MSVQQLISHFRECLRRLPNLQGRSDYLPLSCALLRQEGPGERLYLLHDPFARVLGNRLFHCPGTSVGYGDSYGLAFYPSASDATRDRLTSALKAVEAITGAACRLLPRLPREVVERLALPDEALTDRDNWWRVVFHLAWHFPGPFLEATRWRLFTTDGEHCSGKSCETFVQLNGTAERHDLFPGTIFSVLEDLCYCSEAAIKVIVDALEQHVQTERCEPQPVRSLSSDQRRNFDRLKSDFLAGTGLPVPQLECKLLMLDNSFETPPAREWAALEQGGCHEKMPRLSRLNALQQIAQIRGPAAEWFCRAAERAGEALPIGMFPECSILYERVHRDEAGNPLGRIGGPRPVVNRGPLERWVGFVFAILHQHEHAALQIHWQKQDWLHYGFATLDRDLFAASALAIDLARLSTAAEEASNRERASCSPFSVPSMEEQGVQWDGIMPSSPPPPENYTLGQLVQFLRQFGESYHQRAEQIRQQHPAVQRGDWVQLGASVSHARDSLQRIAGFNELRALAQSLWGEEISFVVGQRIVDTLVQRSNGSLSASDAEGLALAQAASQLSAPPGARTPQEPLADTVPPAGRAEDEVRPSRPNGVEGGCWLWWEGQRRDIPKGVVYRLIAFMWDRDSAPYDNLEGPVFEDAILPDSLRARVSETNRVLKKIGVPWRLKTDATSRILTKHVNS
jgi:hypothetical protein